MSHSTMSAQNKEVVSMKLKLLFVIIALVLIVGFVLPGCASEPVATTPIKIGVLTSLTGARATMGKEVLDGIRQALDEVNYEVAGRQIELVVEDIEDDPAISLSKVTKLNEMDKVGMVLGPLSSAQTLAIRDYIDRNKLLTISPMGAIPEMIEDEYTKYFFRSSYNYDQENSLAAYVAYEVKGYRKAVAIFLDYVDGHGNWGPFKEVFEGLGGTVVQEITMPINTPDYGPYMAQIDVENADFIWSFHLGGDAIRFMKALDQYGIKGKLPLFFSASTVSEGWLTPVGDSALGIESVTNYSPTLATAENERFVQAIQDKYQEQATIPIEHGYVAARMAILALQTRNGDIEDVNGMIKALENLKFEAPRGPIEFEKHTPVQNYYHRVVERVDGKLQNTVLEDTYTDIGPYWLPAELR